MPKPSASPGLVDTSVVIALKRIGREELPDQLASAAVSLAELAAGTHATEDAVERARRQERLQRAEAAFEPIPFDVEAARAYGGVYAAVATAGRKPRGRRSLDLLIGSTALAAGLPLYTRDPADFGALEGLIDVRAVGEAV